MSSPFSCTLSSAAEDSSKLTKSSPDRAIAFLVHSPDSVRDNLPPDCDNKPLARQRRRRTSPDDQKKLEEAFACNPRPSKEERAALLDNVALGDKEVQIWFQNRRQSSRRKTKPLDIIDMNASLSGSSSAPSSPIEKPLDVENGSEQELESDVVTGTGAEETVVEDKNVAEDEPAFMKEVEAMLARNQKGIQPTEEAPAVEQETQDTTKTTNTASSREAPASTLQTDFGSSQSIPSSSQDVLFTSITKPTYLANRRSASYVRVHTSDSVMAPQAAAGATPAPKLRTSKSCLRLSMSEDGQARVIDRSAPSPPRMQPVEISPIDHSPSTSLRRSYSAAGLNDLFKQSSSQGSNPSKAPRLSQAGRSRDSRAWEFWCDSEARTSLATKAEQENSGSAADAIGLIRQSSRKALRPSSSKANSPMLTSSSFTAINAGTKPARRPLQRASTTHGRLQEFSQGGKPRKPTSEDMSPGPDSDKENWDPDENAAAPPRRRPVGSGLQRRRTVLGENANIPSYSTSLGGLMESEKKRRRSPEKLDAEVAAFMGGDVDESEAVRGLLGLARGNWR